MTGVSKIIAAILTVAAAVPATAATPEKPAETRIAFANHGGIRNWRAVDRDTLLIEGQRNQWYRAELFGPCLDLPYAQAIGFAAEPNGSFDRFSKIVVRGETCQLRSLVKLDTPPARRKSDAKHDA